MQAPAAQFDGASAVDIGALLDRGDFPWRRIMLSARDNVWTLVDAVDFPWLAQTTWNRSWGSRTPWQIYAKRNVGRDRATLRMHREILILADPRGERFMAAHHVDHLNRQTLDNRRQNLAWKTNLQNARNSGPRSQIPTLEAIVLQLMADQGVAFPQEIPF